MLKEENMIKNIMAALILTACLLSSCSHSQEDKEKFINAYLDILIVRERFEDSLAANAEVVKVYDKYGFTEASFKDKFFELAEKPDEFIQVVDSIRSLAKRKVKQIEEINKDKIISTDTEGIDKKKDLIKEKGINKKL